MKYFKFLTCAFLLIFTNINCKKSETVIQPTPVVLSGENSMISFSLLKKDNATLESDVTATFNNLTIIIELPKSLSGSNLIASFTSSSKSKVSISGVEQVSGITSNKFVNAMNIDVEAENKGKKTYTLELKYIGNAPLSTVNNTTSYYYRLNTKTWVNYGDVLPSTLNFYPGGYLARAFYDFDKDGDEDLIMGNLNYDNSGLVNSPKPVNYVQNNSGTYADVSGSKFQGGVPGLVHPRKLILGDYDNNGWMDFIMAGHGFDLPPFPGEKAIIGMNSSGSFTSKDLLPIGFYHSVCSGDIDNDGDVDLFFTDTKKCKFFLNDGKGNFTIDNSIFPSDINNLNYFTSEIFDLNADGYLDLIISGHEHEGAPSTIFWGSYTGKYTKSKSVIIPKITGWGVAIDLNIFDINNDGKMDVIINRQGDGTSGPKVFYGCNIQIMIQQNDNTFADNSSTLINGNQLLTHPKLSWFWVDWLRMYDVDGDGRKDLVTDNKFYNLQWKNNNGVFAKF